METESSGLIHIYCGDGKGKTTAAIGLGIRAAGSGMNVLIARFLKNNLSSELVILNQIKNITVLPIKKEFGFYSSMTDDEKSEAREIYSQLLSDVIDASLSNQYQMIILDEITAAYQYSLIDDTILLDFLANKPEQLEVVITGRDPSIKLIELADYVSNIEKIKHPYDEGITARTGIEK